MRTMFLLTALLLLCAGACHCAPKQEFLYVTLRDGTVQGYAVGTDGHLTALPFAPTQVTLASVPSDTASGMNVTADPVRPLLYVSSYRIVPVARQNCVSVVDPSAVPTYSSTLRAFSVGPDGHLTALAPAPVPANEAVHAVVPDPQGRFLYALAEGGSVFIYSIGKNGALTRHGKTTLLGTFGTAFTVNGDLLGGATDECLLTFDRNGKFVTLCHNTGFVDHSEVTLARYRVGRNKHLYLAGEPVDDTGQIIAVCPAPDSRSVYMAAYRTRDGVHSYINVSGVRAFRVQKNGALRVLPRRVGLAFPSWAALTPSGKQLLVAYSDNLGQDGKSFVAAFAVQKDGTLTRTATTPTRDADALDPSGRFLYGTRQSGKYPNYTYALVGCAMRPDGKLGTPFTLPVRGVPESLVFVQR